MTPNVDQPSVDRRSVTITGTRSIGSDPVGDLVGAFEAYLRPFADFHTRFYIGGATGVDTAALHWLADNSKAELVVVVPCKIIDQPPVAAGEIEKWRDRGRVTEVVELGATMLSHPAYHARNRWMVERSDFVIGFPRGAEGAGGTWYTLNYAAELGKPRLVVPI